jgi:hypothetical protein
MLGRSILLLGINIEMDLRIDRIGKQLAWFVGLSFPVI